MTAADILPARLDTAAGLDAEAALAGDDLLSTILDRTSGGGAPVASIATDNPKTMEQSVDLVAAGDGSSSSGW